VFFSLLIEHPSRNLRAPSADHRETSPHDWNLSQFYKLTPKIRGGGRCPPKLGAKNMQNFGRFYTTIDFDRKYLRNGSRYPKTNSSMAIPPASNEKGLVNFGQLVAENKM